MANNLKSAVSNFRKLQETLARFGAMDTEPNGVFNYIVKNAVKGLPFPPLDTKYWELYTRIGVDSAAEKLTAAAKEVHNAILESPHGEVMKFVKENDF